MGRFVVVFCTVAWSGSLALASCATYEDDLMRGERAFEQSEHERALAIFRALERDAGRLSGVGRAHYAYLRGMTDYRIGYRVEARHWLALASAMHRQTPGSLPPEWEKRMSESLQELNEEVYGGGIGSQSGPPVAKDREAVEAEDVDAASSSDAHSPPGLGTGAGN
jgi:hypothetical protein